MPQLIRTLLRPLFIALLPLAIQLPAYAGDSVDHRVDEKKNKGGAHKCESHKDCDGKRTCSPFGWCQGNARPSTDLTVPKPPVQQPTPMQMAPVAPVPTPNVTTIATPAGIDGIWTGLYERRNPKSRGIDLKLVLNQQDNSFSGRGDSITRALQVGEATTTENGIVDGQVDATGQVRFRLVLRNGPIRDFKGTLAPNGQSISGTWNEGRATGVFVIQRTAADPHCTPAQVASAPSHGTGDVEAIKGQWGGEMEGSGPRAGAYWHGALVPKDGALGGRGTFTSKRDGFRNTQVVSSWVGPDGHFRFAVRFEDARPGEEPISFEGRLQPGNQVLQGRWNDPLGSQGEFVFSRSSGPGR